LSNFLKPHLDLLPSRTLKLFWLYLSLSKSGFGDLRIDPHLFEHSRHLLGFVWSDYTWIWQFFY